MGRGAGRGGGRERTGAEARRARALEQAVRRAVADGDLATARRRLDALARLPFARTPDGAALTGCAAAQVALAADRPANADALATAAAEEARAAAADPLEARAALLAGRAQAALGAADVAAERFAEAAALARRCGDRALADEAARLRALHGLPGEAPDRVEDRPAGPAHADGLTARQLEIAQLAADGRTDREVAAALGISAHTVNSHLRAAFRRLGVHRRGALAEALAARARR